MPQQPLTTDIDGARRFLELRFGGAVAGLEYVGEGMWSRCFGFTLDGRESVIRFGRHVEDFRRDRFASRWSTAAMPVPLVSEIGRTDDGWYAISERAHGTPWEQLDGPEWQRTMPSLLAALDGLRSADLEGTSGFGSWDSNGVAPSSTWAGYLATVSDDPPLHRTHGWRDRLAESPLGTASFDRGVHRMLELAEATPDDARSVIHNDLLNRNALAADGRVTALFDWGCSLFGDFVYELATLVFWSAWYPIIDASDVLDVALAHYERIGLDLANFDDRLRCCAIHVGLVHLGHSAFLGDVETQRWIDDRMAEFDGRRT